jgi:outer membrane protein assembly factor BamB
MTQLDLQSGQVRVRAWRRRGVQLGAAMSLALLFGTTFSFGRSAALATTTGDWPTYQLNNARTGYSADETSINATTVPNLRQHWVLSAPGAIFSQPVEANSNIYWGSWDGFEHATQLSGSGTWATYLGQTTASGTNCNHAQDGVASTATVAGTTVYVGGGDAHFYALDANTGRVLWRTKLGSSPSHFIWSSPALFNQSIYIGLASLGDCPLVQGELIQMDAATGKVQHTFEVVPHGCTGGGVWGSPTVDEAAGTIFFATGNPGSCVSPNTEAVIEVNASDLSLVARWQVRGSDAGDLDFGSTPTLFQATINGVLTPMVGVVNKDGTFYAFGRTSLGSGPMWRTNIARAGACPSHLAPSCGNGSIAPAAWDGTRLYVGGGATSPNGTSCAGSVNALDPATGASIWRHCVTSGPVIGAVTAVSGVVFCSQGSYFMALDASTGNALFQYQFSNPSLGFWGAASVSRGVVYVGNSDSRLFAFGL